MSTSIAIPESGRSAPDPLSPTRPDGLTIFCLVWALAECFHILSFVTSEQLPFAIVRLATVLAFLLRPSDLKRFGLMLAADATYILVITPMTANHIFITALADATMLVLVLDAMRGSGPLDRKRLYRNMQSLLRVLLILLYGFAVLHKLNTDYFNPSVSCAGQLLVEMRERFPFLPAGEGTLWFSIIGTLALEAAIPLLLIFRPTRLTAIALGLGFHYFLSAHQHIGLYSFTALMFALFLASLPADFAERVGARVSGWSSIRSLADRWDVRSEHLRAGFLAAGTIVLAGTTLVVLAFGVTGVHQLNAALYTAGQLLWAPYGLLLMFLFAIGVQPSRPSVAQDSFVVGVQTWAWIMPVLVFLHSFSPYLGLKTVPCLAMFSNLRTEGDVGNHLFIPSSLKVFGYQEDLVEVVRASDDKLADLARERVAVPYFEFCRKVNAVKDPLTITYVRRGVTHELVDAGPDNRPGIDKTPWLLGKFLRFRAVDLRGPNQCRW